MNMSLPRLSAVLARIGVLTLIAVVLAVLMLDALLGLSERWQQYQSTQDRVAAFAQRLSRPVTHNRFEAYSVFLAQTPDENLASSLQNELISLVNTHSGQVVDIRELPGASMPEGPVALRLHLVFEGDVQTVTEILTGLAALEHPILLDNANIRAASPGNFPDRHLRASLDMTIWSEKPT